MLHKHVTHDPSEVGAPFSWLSAVMSTIPARPPAILYGTAWKAERTAELVHLAILQGFRGIDTAAQRKHYREDLVGLGVQSACKALGLSRKDIWLQTKFTPISGQDVQGPIPYDPEANVADQVCSSFKHSLQHLHPAATLPDIRQLFIQYAVSAKNGSHQPEAPLQDVYIDSYLFHSPLSTLQATLEAWRVMEAWSMQALCGTLALATCTIPIFLACYLKRHASSHMCCRTGGMPQRATMYHYWRNSRLCSHPTCTHYHLIRSSMPAWRHVPAVLDPDRQPAPAPV